MCSLRLFYELTVRDTENTAENNFEGHKISYLKNSETFSIRLTAKTQTGFGKELTYFKVKALSWPAASLNQGY